MYGARRLESILLETVQATVTAGLTWAPDRLPNRTIIVPTVRPKPSPVRTSGVKAFGPSSKDNAIIVPGPIRTRVYVPTSSDRHSFRQLEQGMRDNFCSDSWKLSLNAS